MSEAPPKGATLVLAASMFLTGACGLVAQYVLSTVSTYILGNSIEQFSVTIALMLLMMGVAGAVQSLLSDRGLIERFVLTEGLLALLSGFAPVALYAAYAQIPDHFVLVQVLLVLAVGFLIGIEIPLAIRINARYAPTLKGNIASIWSLDYVGSFVGAIVWTYFLLRTMPIDRIGFTVGFVNLGVGVLTLGFFARHRLVKGWRWVGGALVLCAVLMGLGASRAPAWTEGIERSLYDDPVVHAETSPYQRIVVTHGPKLNDTRLYLNGNLQFSSVDEAIYHENLVHPAMVLAPRRERVLILGGGDGLALREVLKYRDVREVTLVDLDPAMIRLARRLPALRKLNGGAFDDARVQTQLPQGLTPIGMRRDVRQVERDSPRPNVKPVLREVARVEIFNVDADRFLGVADGNWDVLIVDLPDPNSVELAKLYSREFYRKARRVLGADGVMVVQATSPYHAKETFLCVRRTVEAAGFEALPIHDNVPSFGDWGFLLASPSKGLAERLTSVSSLPVATRYLTPELMRRSMSFGKEGLRSEFNDVSTLMRPVVLDRYLRDGWRVE